MAQAETACRRLPHQAARSGPVVVRFDIVGRLRDKWKSRMTRIRVLPDLIVKKIAAGEVIERPAAAVKELLENAVDAGATTISTDIDDGGCSLIRVCDDGCGMTPDDLPLAVTPHATSKLNDEDDLYRIGSLGFRGEALASIGAVSRLNIRSRRHELPDGAEIHVEAEQVKLSSAAGGPAGTTVEVRDLFFNVPARRRFLKNARTEFGHVNTQFLRIAMASPRLALELSHNGRSVHRLPSTDCRLERIGKCYSSELADALIHFERSESGLSIEGYAAPPADARSSSNWQFIFVNGRFVRDRFIQHAIKDSFRGLIDPHRYPVVFLFVTIDPAAVDVNVHPTKTEVRWQNSNVVHSQVLSATREALRSADLTPSLSTARHTAFAAPEDQDRLRREFVEQLRHGDPAAPRVGPDLRNEGGGFGRTGGFDGAAMPPSSERPGPDAWRALLDSSPTEGEAAALSRNRTIADLALQGGRPAIQLHNTYLVCETEDGLIIIDQHALHERVLFEQFKQRIAAGRLESQRLLLPESLRVTAEQTALLETHADLLSRLGVEVAPFGRDEVAIHAVPALIKNIDAASFLRDLIDRLEQHPASPDTDDVFNDVLAMTACKAAVKAGDPLTADEIATLVDQRALVEKSSNCPHGRPTTLRLTVKDLERQFRRT